MMMKSISSWWAGTESGCCSDSNSLTRRYEPYESCSLAVSDAMRYALPHEPTGPAARRREKRGMHRRLGFLVMALLLAACGGQGAGPRATPAPALRNPLDVPLYPNSEILAVHTFRQVVTGDQTHGTVFAGGAGTYDGTEVLAANTASF